MLALRRRKFVRLLAVALGLFAVYALISLPDALLPAYHYETADQGFLYIESPGKGDHNYQTAHAAFVRYRDWRGDHAMVLYRTTKPDYSNPWMWYDIATNPRWQLPYMEPAPKDTTAYWEAVDSNQRAAREHSQRSH
jgi:hypothetical protein